MNKKLLIGIGILVAVIILLSIFAIFIPKPGITKKNVSQRFSEFEVQYNEKKMQGYDVSDAEGFARQASQAFNKSNNKEANRLLDKAFESLGKASIPAISKTVNVEESKGKLSWVKVAVLYQTVTDGITVNRSIGDIINIFKETKTDFIFKGWWRQKPIPDSPDMEPNGYFTKEYIKKAAEYGYTYKQLEDAIKKIKGEMPNIIFSGSVSPQFLYSKVPELGSSKGDWDPVTKEAISREKAWTWALDPSNWGLTMSKEEFQKYWAKNHQHEEITDPKNQLRYFFPDMTNPEYQEFLLHLIEKQIDSGADAIRIDMLFTQPAVLAVIAKSTEHQAVNDSCRAVSKIVDEVHRYGDSKGKYIYVGSWENSVYTKEAGFIEVCKNNPPSLDFIHLSPPSSEVANMRFDEDLWNGEINRIRNTFGNITIFAFVDWAFTTKAPLGVFSQQLTSDEQKEFLKISDEFFQRKGIIFIYPVHGGDMGNPTGAAGYKYSFGKNTFYDALAPEFQTYETIKELALNKSK